MPVEQGRLARPAIPRHLRRCNLCKTKALGDERHFGFEHEALSDQRLMCSKRVDEREREKIH